MNTECWEWRKSRTPRGYGRAQVRGKRVRVHRFIYEWLHGPIPDGLGVLHRCDNPPCFNPDHLFLGTQADNMRDMVAKGRALWTHCKNGHEFNDANTSIRSVRGTRNLQRACRVCDRERWRKRKALSPSSGGSAKR